MATDIAVTTSSSHVHELPATSPWLFRRFVDYTRWYLRRHFSQVLMQRQSVAGLPPGRPLILFMNHPCWWDPLMGILLAGTCWPERTHFAAMDAEALESYGIFKRLGFFGVDRGSARGAIRFVRTAQRIVEEPRTALWITPQGRYADVRERPVTLLAGLSHVLSHLQSGIAVPIALEYAFWDERLPIAAAEIGQPLDLSVIGPRSADAWDLALADALTSTQDQLAQRIMSRDRREFEVLVEGGRGLGNLYGGWRSLRMRWTSSPRPPQPDALAPQK